MAKRINDMATEFASREYHDIPSTGIFGTGDYEEAESMEYEREIAEKSYIRGAEDVLKEIEDIMNAPRVYSHPFPTISMRFHAITDKIQELRG